MEIEKSGYTHTQWREMGKYIQQSQGNQVDDNAFSPTGLGRCTSIEISRAIRPFSPNFFCPLLEAAFVVQNARGNSVTSM